jgi:hypothetical protein
LQRKGCVPFLTKENGRGKLLCTGRWWFDSRGRA